MSSLKGFLRNGKPTPADLTRWLHTTLAGIARCTVDGREEDLAGFRTNMLALASNINEHASGADVESTVADALTLSQEYNERALNFHSLHTSELKAVMRTLTETITYLSESRTRSVHQLNFMERELEQASQIDDIRLLRGRLVSCLDIVREETVRLQSESAARSTEVRQQIDRAVKIADPPLRFGSTDSVTGLPARRAAEKTIGDAIAGGGDHAVSVFVVHRLSATNAKYGRAVGDEVMLRVANHFAQHLSSAAFLFRWSGPALVALMPANINAEEIKRSWSKAAGVKQEISLEANQRSVFIVVETTMSFELITKKTTPEDLFHRLDKFVADQGGDAD
jgi:GGDEF domain-containing protein